MFATNWKLLWIIPLLPCGLAAAVDAGRANQLLNQALDARNPETRKMAVVALSLMANGDPLLDRLASMLDDKDVQVRVAAVTSLGEVKNQRATAALEKALQEDIPEVSFAAAKALYARQAPDGKKALLAVLSGENKAASKFLTQQKRDALRMLYTPRTTFLYALRQGMGFVPLPGFGEGVASLEGLLSDPGVSGRAAAALLLGKEKDAATVGALEDALYDKDWHVRAAAVHSLALQNDPARKKDLEPLLDDARQDVLPACGGRLAAADGHRDAGDGARAGFHRGQEITACAAGGYHRGDALLGGVMVPAAVSRAASPETAVDYGSGPDVGRIGARMRSLFRGLQFPAAGRDVAVRAGAARHRSIPRLPL